MSRQDIASAALPELQDAVKDVCSLRIGPVADIGAQIFPELALYRKQTAAFYTIPASAELLAGLAISKLSKNSSYRIGDFASGTGTLLKAAYRYIIRKIKSDGAEFPKSRHKEYMESYLLGADIQPIAANLTCAGLAGIFPDVPFDKSNIVCAPVSEGRSGSLELFVSATLRNLLEPDSNLHVSDKSLDLAIMNPPYTAPGGKPAFMHSGLNPQERKDSQNKVREMFQKGRIPGNMQAGFGLIFSSLADKKLKTGGIFAFVLSMKAAGSSSWEGFRKHMTENYKDLVVVGSDQSFSESTKINELLVCGKKRQHAIRKDAPVLMVTLKRRPRDFVESHELSKIIQNLEKNWKENGGNDLGDILIGSEKIGSYYISQQSDGEPWPVLGHCVELKRISERLASGNLLYPGMTKEAEMKHMKPLSKHGVRLGPHQAKIGHIEGDQLKNGPFVFKNMKPGDRTNLSLWKADCKKQNALFCPPTHRGILRAGWEIQAEDVLEGVSSTLFMSREFSPASQSLAVAMTKHKCLGGRAWIALICREDAVAAYWLWFNSIFGLLPRWHRADKSQTGRISMQITDMKKITCPDFSSDECGDMREVANKFASNFGKKILNPCAMAWRDESRHEIDNAVVEMMGIEMGHAELQNLREMWCRERSVHRGKQEIVRLLKEDGLWDEE